MREPAGILIALGAALVAAACANQPAAKGAVSVEQVVEMSRSGASASTIIAKMQQTRSVYLLPGAGVAMLRQEGVPEPVLEYMSSTRSQAEREQADQCFKWVWCIRGPPYMVVR